MADGLEYTIVSKESSTIPIYHISYKTRYWMNASIIRIRELCDEISPSESVVDLMDELADTYGKFTYLDDYHGHCLDEIVFKKFYTNFTAPLNNKELFIKNSINSTFGHDLKLGSKSRFVILFTHQDDPEYEGTFNHEICHAIYSLDDSYKKAVKQLIKEVDANIIKELKKIMLEWEYPASEFNNEVNAYLSTSSMRWIRKNMNISGTFEVVKKFRKLLKVFAKKHGIVLKKMIPDHIINQRYRDF